MNAFLWSFYKCAGLAEVATVGVLCDGKLLMGKRRDNGRWTNPGGHLDPGEDPMVGAKRELYEEAGIKADKLTHLVSKEVTTFKGKRIVVHAYKYEPTTLPATSMKQDPDLEVHRWQWVSTSHGLPPEVADNLHSPKNVLLQALGLQEMEKTAAGVLSKVVSRATHLTSSDLAAARKEFARQIKAIRNAKRSGNMPSKFNRYEGQRARDILSLSTLPHTESENTIYKDIANVGHGKVKAVIPRRGLPEIATPGTGYKHKIINALAYPKKTHRARMAKLKAHEW